MSCNFWNFTWLGQLDQNADVLPPQKIRIWLLTKFPLSANGHSSRIKMLLSRNFRELHVYLLRGPCWATTPLMKIRSPSNTESLLRTDCCWLVFLGKVYWPTAFNMHFDFCPLLRRTLAKLSRKYPYSQTPAISRGELKEKRTPVCLGAWLSQSLAFGNLAAASGACFLRLQKASLGSDRGRCFRTMVSGCPEGLTFGSSAATYKGQGDGPKAPPHRELDL